MPEELQIPEPPKTVVKREPHSKIKFLIYFIGGLIEVLLFFRLIFKLSAADATTSGFVNFIYLVTNPFVAPYGIFVFEPGTVIAMFVYAVLAWGIAKIIMIAAGRPRDNK